MYIKKIKINKFRVLEDIEVRFQGPDLSAVEEKRGNGNVVNVIAGVNGTGKTSFLESIFYVFQNINGLPVINVDRNFYDTDLTVVNDDVGLGGDGRVVWVDSRQSFKYEAKIKLPLGSFVKVDPGAVLGNAEAYIKEFVVRNALSSRSSDPVERINLAVEKFNELFSNVHILTKLSGLDGEQGSGLNRPLFENARGGKVTIQQLSDGEKQLYGRVISLMLIAPNNSVVLIDEPEIALHPAWQQKIMQIYSRIGTNNQFIVATHSPQVIRSIPYKNRIILSKQGGKIQPVYFDQPPSGVDVNSILSEVMGADPIPANVLNLYQEYRGFIESGQEQSEGAQSVRSKLLEYEGEHSAFMQEMNFLVELRDAA
uniref:ATP-binding protein n=1 Tax=uncultured Thiotrichaceae bacterium TaxID=298394 RepID=A0A6S6SRG8_9GAMM|nr:MAG: Unknown protein [uncultured Thiotrichaceae bacterium]